MFIFDIRKVNYLLIVMKVHGENSWGMNRIVRNKFWIGNNLFCMYVVCVSVEIKFTSSCMYSAS